MFLSLSQPVTAPTTFDLLHPTQLRNKARPHEGYWWQKMCYIIAKSEDELQMAVNEMNEIAKNYDMIISSSKTKKQ
jgi:hypothetical protein